MAVYLSFLDYPKHSQQMIETASFMSKHKISINNPVQAHYTVEGVQSYAPEELKAIKQRQDRVMQGKQGTYISPKVVLLSDQIIEFEQRDPLEAKQPRNKQKQKQKQKVRVQSAKSGKPRISTRNAVSSNNQAIVKLEKEVAKRNTLQRKLQKMSQKYKQYFKGVDLKQGYKKHAAKQEKQYENQQQQVHSQLSNEQPQETIKEYDATTEDKSSIHKSSTKANKKGTEANINAKKHSKFSNPIKQDRQEQESVNGSRNSQLDLGLDLVMRSTTYSEKLGSAIHEMFK